MDTLSNLEFTAVVKIFQISLGTSINDVRPFLMIFNPPWPPSYHVQQFLTYNNIIFWWVILNTFSHPNFGRHWWTFPFWTPLIHSNVFWQDFISGETYKKGQKFLKCGWPLFFCKLKLQPPPVLTPFKTDLFLKGRIFNFCNSVPLKI